MTATTFDHQVGKSLEFFEQQPSSARSQGINPASTTGIQDRAYDQWVTLCKVWPMLGCATGKLVAVSLRPDEQ